MVEVSKSKSINKYLESTKFLTIEQNAIVWFAVKLEYFLGHRVHPCFPVRPSASVSVSKWNLG